MGNYDEGSCVQESGVWKSPGEINLYKEPAVQQFGVWKSPWTIFRGIDIIGNDWDKTRAASPTISK